MLGKGKMVEAVSPFMTKCLALKETLEVCRG